MSFLSCFREVIDKRIAASDRERAKISRISLRTLQALPLGAALIAHEKAINHGMERVVFGGGVR